MDSKNGLYVKDAEKSLQVNRFYKVQSLLKVTPMTMQLERHCELIQGEGGQLCSWRIMNM